MSLSSRRILYIIFIAAFLIITPLIIIYASGYKIKLKNGLKLDLSFEKTGMLVLDTNPAGAKIYLNGEPQQLFLKKYYSKNESFLSTPAKIKNLLPGDYEVKMEIAGYWPWQKKLAVLPSASTYAEDVYFFKKNLPVIISENTAGWLTLSPDKKYLLGGGEKISLINLPGDEKYDFNIGKNALDALWSPDSKKFLTAGKIYDINNLNNSTAFAGQYPKAVNLKWGADSNKIYYLSPGAGKNEIINSFSLKDNKNEIVLTSENEELKITDFLIKDGIIFYVTHSPAETKLNFKKIGAVESARSVDLPASAKYKFINHEHKLINLYDEAGKTGGLDG